MKKKCSNCGLVNFPEAVSCTRCQANLIETQNIDSGKKTGVSSFVVRAVILVFICFAVFVGFYLSLIVSAHRLSVEQKSSVRRAIGVLKNKDFSSQAFLLENVTMFRADDNWLNASVVKENAYAATNFPFEIMTLYPDFFTYPLDDTERAAILLHEAEHLKGKNEKDAYAFVWKHRQQLGWIKAAYGASSVWQNVRKQTVENAPDLFTCVANEYGDCTE